MSELSFLARLVLTLILSLLSLFLYKWLQTPSSTAPPPSSKRFKKRSKKKSATKSATLDSLSSLPQQSSQKSSTPTSTPIVAAQTDGDDGTSDSDSDDGRSAAEVLATRKFKPKSLGGSRLARKIKASLPPVDAVRLAVNQKVLARFGGGDRWFPATVLEQRKGNKYHLKYDDGEIEFRVPADLIKPQSGTNKENRENEKSEAAQAADAKRVVEDAAVEEEEASADESSASDGDGWQVVGSSSVAKRQAHHMQEASYAEPLLDGLTKRQRENRRKKERQREKKELIRQHAQKNDLDARARWRYVPS